MDSGAKNTSRRAVFVLAFLLMLGAGGLFIYLDAVDSVVYRRLEETLESYRRAIRGMAVAKERSINPEAFRIERAFINDEGAYLCLEARVPNAFGGIVPATLGVSLYTWEITSSEMLAAQLAIAQVLGAGMSEIQMPTCKSLGVEREVTFLKYLVWIYWDHPKK